MSLLTNLEQKLNNIGASPTTQNVGFVASFRDGVAYANGLSGAAYNELVYVEVSAEELVPALVFNLEADQVGLLLLSDNNKIAEGNKVLASGEILSLEINDQILGRVVNVLGEPLDGKPLIYQGDTTKMLIEKIASGVITRESVGRPLKTGITVVDALVNVGRGQRELIIGDRQTGKTTIAIDTILNQKGENMVCVYVAIGQKQSKIRQLVERLTAGGAMDYTVVLSASASDSAAFQYLAPYAGVAIAEYFMEKGQDALVVYDDLTKHAWAYRQLSLLFKRPPGREAYPGDVFYLHSRLLERAAQLNSDYGGGSITALPIIETQASDVSAYIPTNVISITDGQIYLESELFNSGIRPAVNPGISVTRVGGSAQTKAMKKVAGSMKLELSQYRELAAFSQFGGDLDKTTQQKLSRGAVITQLLVQPPFKPLSQAEQILGIYAGNKGYLDELKPTEVSGWVNGLRNFAQSYHQEFMTELNTGKWSDEIEKGLAQVCDEYSQSLE
ncbi:MAG: F0F1 ATP synthase subunit alpha [Patescibacteria group bacterium]